MSVSDSEKAPVSLPSEPAAEETVPTPERPAEPSPRSAALAGVIAGAIAAVLVSFLLNASGWLDRPDPVLGQRLAALEGADQGLRADAARSVQRLAALEGRPPPEPDLTPLREDAAALRGEIAALRDALATQKTALEMARASLDQGVRELRETTGGFGLSLAEQRSRIDTLAAQRPDLEPLRAEIGTVQSALGTVKSEMAAQGGRLADLAKRVEALEKTLVSTRVNSTQTAGLALALVELDRALDAGEPLASALDPFVPLAADPAVKAPLDLLQPLRAGGAPTVADLQARLTELRPRIAEAMRHPDGTDWLGQTAANLASLVDLRKVDAAEAAATARLDEAVQALSRGEVDAAAAAIRPLAEGGNAAAGEWLGLAQRRLDGEAGLERLRAYLAAHLPRSP